MPGRRPGVAQHPRRGLRGRARQALLMHRSVAGPGAGACCCSVSHAGAGVRPPRVARRGRPAGTCAERGSRARFTRGGGCGSGARTTGCTLALPISPRPFLLARVAPSSTSQPACPPPGAAARAGAAAALPTEASLPATRGESSRSAARGAAAGCRGAAAPAGAGGDELPDEDGDAEEPGTCEGAERMCERGPDAVGLCSSLLAERQARQHVLGDGHGDGLLRSKVCCQGLPAGRRSPARCNTLRARSGAVSASVDPTDGIDCIAPGAAACWLRKKFITGCRSARGARGAAFRAQELRSCGRARQAVNARCTASVHAAALPLRGLQAGQHVGPKRALALCWRQACSAAL